MEKGCPTVVVHPEYAPSGNTQTPANSPHDA